MGSTIEFTKKTAVVNVNKTRIEKYLSKIKYDIAHIIRNVITVAYIRLNEVTTYFCKCSGRYRPKK